MPALAPDLSWPAVARRYAELADSLAVAERADRASGPVATFAHIVAMSDGIGTFEHAEHSTPRVDEGYCTDDMARVLVAACASRAADDTAAELARMAYLFLIGAQSSDGMIRNRRAAARRMERPLRGRGLLGARDVGIRHGDGTRRRSGCATAPRCRSIVAWTYGRRRRVRWRSQRSSN